MVRGLQEKYNPLYFLAALGRGGLAIAFFMFPMFMVPHKATPLATYGDLVKAFGSGGWAMRGMIVVSLLGFLFFAVQHLRLLFWNIREFGLYRHTEAYDALVSSPKEITLMAYPLALSMTVSVLFTMGALFVPGLWDVVEYLFPLAYLAYLAIGVFAMRLFLRHFSRMLVDGKLDFSANNSLSMLLVPFTFVMVAVGFAAPAAMSHNKLLSSLAIFSSIFFVMVALALIVIHFTLGFKSMFEHGVNVEASPSLWISIPISTLLGITFVRINAGVQHNLVPGGEVSPVLLFVVLSAFVAVQILFGLVGYVVMKRVNYFGEYLHGVKKSVASYSLVCPGVATFVLGMFFIHWGLVKTGIIAQFSMPYFALILLLGVVKFLTIRTLFKLDAKLLGDTQPGARVEVPVPAAV